MSGTLYERGAVAATRRRRRAFDPRSLSGLALWLRADQGLTEASGAVSAWADQSGAGNNSTSTSATKPTLVPNAMNGRPVVRFTAASSTWVAFDAVAALLAGGDTPYSLFFAAAVADTAANRTWISAGRSTGSSRTYFGNNGTAWFCDRLDDAALDVTRQSAVGAVTTAPRVHSIVFAGTTITHNVDGASVLVGAAMDTGAVTLDRFTIGARRLTGIDGFANIDVAELFLVPGRAVASGERQAAERYLAARYGVTLA